MKSKSFRKQGWISRKQKLDRLYELHHDLNASDPESASHWVRYLVVLTSGLIETSVSYIYTEYAQITSSPRVSKYVGMKLAAPTNMTMERIMQLVRSFDEDWCKELQSHQKHERFKASVQSIVTNRNRIAHGEDVGITFGQLHQYYEDAIELLEFLSDQCSRESFAHRKRRRRK